MRRKIEVLKYKKIILRIQKQNILIIPVQVNQNINLHQIEN